MIHHRSLFVLIFAVLMIGAYSIPSVPVVYESPTANAAPSLHVLLDQLQSLEQEVQTVSDQLEEMKLTTTLKPSHATDSSVPRSVPFYSQFTDISRPEWRKIGCGIASLAMLIDYYQPAVAVDTLLAEGIETGAYLNQAGWIHAGLIGVSERYGLTGSTNSLSHLSPEAAFATLREVLADGPVMASVYYTFTPGHPIPHLVVITDVVDDTVYYNDPAEPRGGGSISVAEFLPAWKQRYISIRPQA